METHSRAAEHGDERLECPHGVHALRRHPTPAFIIRPAASMRIGWRCHATNQHPWLRRTTLLLVGTRLAMQHGCDTHAHCVMCQHTRAALTACEGHWQRPDTHSSNEPPQDTAPPQTLLLWHSAQPHACWADDRETHINHAAATTSGPAIACSWRQQGLDGQHHTLVAQPPVLPCGPMQCNHRAGSTASVRRRMAAPEPHEWWVVTPAARHSNKQLQHWGIITGCDG
jgi:hypothetical protein